jgi:hypothetical protein
MFHQIFLSARSDSLAMSTTIVKNSLDLDRFHAGSRTSCSTPPGPSGQIAPNQDLPTPTKIAVKNANVLKECSEVWFWLRVADAKRLGSASKRNYLLKESNQLTSIYASIVRELKA